MKDPTAFRARFNEYKNGKMPYKNGLPAYSEGTPGSFNPYTQDLLKEFEGFNDTVYLDGKGIPTIGYGFTDSSWVDRGKISRAEADAELMRLASNGEDFLINKLGLDNWWSMSDKSKAALISYWFNYPAGFKDTTNFMKLWRSGRYWDAINEVDAGINDAANPGLRTRRLKELSYLKEDPFFIVTKGGLPPKTDAELTIPIVAKSDATAVRRTIPKAKTRARWTGAEKVSPYLTGKPMVKLLKEVKLPNIIEENKKTLWKAPMGFKNGKLPKFYMGTDGDVDMGERALLTNEDIISSVVKMPHEEGLKNGPIEDAIIGYYFGGKPFTLYNAYNNYRYIKNAKRMYKTAREANDNTRNWNNTGPASRRWKMQDADEYARKWAHSDDPLGFLYDTFVTPLSNIYRSAQKHPKIGPVLNLFE